MRFRHALKHDVFSIIQLYQKARSTEFEDKVFLDYRKLTESILSDNGMWIVAEIQGNVEAVISLMIDYPQRICKISRMLVSPSLNNAREVLKETLRYVLHYFNTESKDVDIVYTTTLSMSMEQQGLTLEEGFNILGVFPNVLGEDNSMLNGLTAHYLNGTLEHKRQPIESLHPAIIPFFEISKKQCKIEDRVDLDDLNSNSVFAPLQELEKNTDLPELEMIMAPNFVSNRFDDLKCHHAQIFDFYPFHRPNCMITSPRGEIEIFIRMEKAQRFAAITGEHLKMNVYPVELYLTVQSIIKQHNISYIEIINDASDTFGIDCILKAGFTPCAYFPAFKMQGDTRRDFVVFGKSFEYICKPRLFKNSAYYEFYREYFKIEGKNYFPQLQ